MSEAPPETSPQDAPEVPEAPQEGDGGQDQQVDTFDAAYVKKLREEAATYRVQAKQNADKAAQFDALEESKKTEQQRLEERATQAERQAQEATQTAWRAQVALEKGLTPSQAKRLVGSTVEELTADADEMLADLQPSRPRGDVGQGPRGQDASEPDMNQLIRSGFGQR